MKIEINIDDETLRESITHQVAVAVVSHILGESYSRERTIKAEDLLKKIDWKNAGAQLSETVIQQFFIKLMEKR
jgi:hypothetical protein